MKLNLLIIVLSGFLANPAAFAAEGTAKLIKSCSTTLTLEGSEGADMIFEINNSDEGLSAVITTIKGGEESVMTDTVKYSTHSVRPGLTADSMEENLNLAEGLVVHAMMWMADPTLSEIAKLEMDLDKIRSAGVYFIGEATMLGGTAIVEAYDADGLSLGSFLGGFLVGQCK